MVHRRKHRRISDGSPFQMDRTELQHEYAELSGRRIIWRPVNGWSKQRRTGTVAVVNVSFEDATAFAAWRSKRDGVSYRLPTEEEWEYAARNGERGDLYPWGPDWKENAAVLKEATPASVDSRPGGKNKWGVADLIGNVWEWTSPRSRSIR